MIPTSCFKSYDIRGKTGIELTPTFAYALGHAIATVLQPETAITGRDIRMTSPQLQAALCAGLSAAGVAVADIGLCGTEEVYFATDHYAADVGIMVTASHNPAEYNGFKLVGPGARPLSDAEFRAIRQTVADSDVQLPFAPLRGNVVLRQPRAAYVERVLSFIDPARLKPLRVVVNAGNGAAGPTFDAIANALTDAGAPVEFIRINHAPDGTFPKGIPNPLLPENHAATGNIVRREGADFGVAWDGDFDRCFFFDQTGTFVPGEYIVGLLAKSVLQREPGAAIVHDPRVVWNTQRVVAAAGGRPISSRTGHALVKAKMRQEEAAYGGEMSAHHYFRDFMYCDSGMIPLLLILGLISESGQGLAAEVAEMRMRHPSSGEINFTVSDPQAVMDRIAMRYAREATHICHLDGLSMSFADWRFNLRASNTEPLLRLNIETRGNTALLARHQHDLANAIVNRDMAA